MPVIPALIIALAMASTTCDESIKPAALALQRNDANVAKGILDKLRSECSQSSYFNELDGVVDEFEGKPEEAETAFRKAVSLDPKSPRLLSDLGLSYLKNQKLADGAKALQQALDLDPTDERAAKYSLGAYVDLKDWPQALAVTQRIAPATNAKLLHDRQFLLWVSQTLLEEKQAARLERLLSLNAYDFSPPLLFSIGTLFAQHGMYQSGIAYLNRIPRQLADEAVYFNLGLAYSHLKQFDRARENYYNAIDKDAEAPDAFFRVGLDFAAAGQVRKAIPWLFRARSLGPDRADIAYALCEQLLLLQYVNTAADVVDAALAKNPGDALLTVARGDVALVANNTQNAEQMYKQALERQAKLVPALVGLARTAQQSANGEAAQKYLENALSVEVDDPAANRQMGLIEAGRGRWAAALAHFERAWKVDRSNPDVGLELARALRHSNRPADGLAVLNSIRPALSASSGFHFELAQIYIQLHRSKDANAERERIQNLQADTGDVLRFENPKTYVH
jgi:predicted Zn-dependent protease